MTAGGCWALLLLPLACRRASLTLSLLSTTEAILDSCRFSFHTACLNPFLETLDSVAVLFPCSAEAFAYIGLLFTFVESTCCGLLAVCMFVLWCDDWRGGFALGLLESLEFALATGCAFFVVCSSDSEFVVVFSTNGGVDLLEELSLVLSLANFTLAAAWACRIFSMWN